MSTYDFTAKVQSKDRANSRKTIELPPEVRKNLDVKDHVKIKIDKKTEFFANVQSKTKTEGRKLIELPPNIRSSYKVGQNVRVKIEKL